MSYDDDDEPVTEKQLGFMQHLGVKVPKGCTKWQASDLITAALDKQRSEAPPPPLPSKASKSKSGCGCLTLVVLAFILWAVFSGDDVQPEPEHTSPEPDQTAEQDQTPAPAPVVDWKARAQELYAEYLPEHTAPAIGSPVTINTARGSTTQGTLHQLTDSAVTIAIPNGQLTYQRAELAPGTRAELWASDYAKAKALAQVQRDRAERGL